MVDLRTQLFDVAFDLTDVFLGGSQGVFPVFDGSIQLPDGVFLLLQFTLEVFELVVEFTD